MPECKKCKIELMWGQPYKKGDRPVNPDGSKHTCKGTQFQELEIWRSKWDTEYKFKCPIFCNVCQKSFKYNKVCFHMREQGFVEGVDTVEFYSDKWSAVKKRQLIRNKKKEKPKPAKRGKKRPKPI